MDPCGTPRFCSLFFTSHRSEYSPSCWLNSFKTTEDACQICRKFLIFSAEHCGQQCQRP